MRRLVFFLTTIFLVIACSETPQEQATQLAQQAATCCEEGRLMEARLLIDSLRRTYPDIVEARKAALKLHQDVEIKIAQQELARTDSLLILANRELEARQQQVDANKAALRVTADKDKDAPRLHPHPVRGPRHEDPIHPKEAERNARSGAMKVKN